MMPMLRRSLAMLLVACLLSLSLSSCSQPIDQGSPVPAQSQPLVALIALVAVGIGLVALHHHNEHHGGGGPPQPGIIPPVELRGLPNSPFDLSLDLTQPGAVGALGTNGGAGRYGFVEVLSSGANNGSYALPNAFQPRAFAIDASSSSDDWFVDPSGAVRKCAPPTSGVTQCAPLLSFTDGLPSGGTRSIAADGTHIFIIQDNNSNTVSWVSFALDGTGRTSGSYTYTGLSTLAANAVSSITGTSGISTFEVFHKDGASYVIQLPGPAVLNPFKLTPPPALVATVDGANFYGIVGSPTTGQYQIAHYVGAGTGSTPGTIVNRITIAINGQTSSDLGFFSVPFIATTTDGFNVYSLDGSNNLVIFTINF